LFPIVIVDEATQAVEPTVLIPLIHYARKLVLVGDDKQLGPVVANKELEDVGYGRSMFERLIQLGVPKIMLDKQYRMHPEISAFPNVEFYGGGITDGITPQDRAIPQFSCFPVQGFPLVFINLQDGETQVGTSFQNATEARAVQTVVAMLMRGDVRDSEIGVISPYLAQVTLLRSMLSQSRFPKLKIATVDSFQGSEKNYIIMSCVRSGGTIGFVRDARRFNVSITRARCALIVVGDATTLSQQSPLWARFIDRFTQKGAIRRDLPRIPS
jgi:regulator of nonsense transcripts 1